VQGLGEMRVDGYVLRVALGWGEWSCEWV
jgi:hypothetical protein